MTRAGHGRSSKQARHPGDKPRFAWAWPDARHYYVPLSALLVLLVGRTFYGYQRVQTEHALLWFAPGGLSDLVSGARQPDWSAPLDDVFIHFDFAQSIAQGAPFSWMPGNGYSSGGTSLLYPFVLALGRLVGFAGLELMHFAATVGAVCTFGTLLGMRRIFAGLAPAWALLLPPSLLSVGALAWSLFSGMEVALFLATYALCLVAWDDLGQAHAAKSARPVSALGLGLCGVLLVGTRPEAAPLLAVFGVWAATVAYREMGRGQALWTLLLSGAPGGLLFGLQLWANRHFTGSASAAGALAKLEMHHPYLTASEVWTSWQHFVVYQVERLSGHHFSAAPVVGYVVWPLACAGLLSAKTRRFAALLLISVTLWILQVALNGQVRWQNERYSMPAAAWLLMAAALGTAALVDLAWQRSQVRSVRLGFAAGLSAVWLTFAIAQVPRYRDQIWFFGRASRNILEQHLRAGSYLGAFRQPRPHRILLSDAGALPFASGLPAIDLIGLGGYHGWPWAEASRQGVGAAVELMEHVDLADRPDIMALYPGWWGTFVLWFGRPERDFPVRGNVICGGTSKVIYRPDWSALDIGGLPLSMGTAGTSTAGASTTRANTALANTELVDIIDIADLLSERAHGVGLDQSAKGFVDMKLLPHPEHLAQDVWDAGRVLGPGLGLRFNLSDRGRALTVRVAPAQPAEMRLEWPGGQGAITRVAPSDGWQEIQLPLPEQARSGQARPGQARPGQGAHQLTLRIVSGELTVYHLFVLGGGASEGSQAAP